MGRTKAAELISTCLLAALAFIGALTPGSSTANAANAWPDEVPNFAMLDARGRYHEFHRTPSRAVVLFFTENGCPISRQYLPKLKSIREEFAEKDVTIWVVDANTSDDRKSILKEAHELGVIQDFPFLRDDTQGVAKLLGVTRTATVVAISTKDSHVFYHGAVDDQLSEGAAKPEAGQHYLEDALHEFLAERSVKQAVNEAHGCLISFTAKMKDAEISYARDVAPILEKHCVECHSAGNIGPFAMANYAKVNSKSAMIQEVLLSKRMPPWFSDPEGPHFANERTMTLDETRTLLAWIAQGAPRGEGEDPLPALKIPPAPEWPLGKPDFVVKLPKPEEVPATGVLEYRHIKIDAPVTEDTWLGAVAIHADNRKVIHHCIVRTKYADGPDDGSGRGAWLAGWAPGYRPRFFPEGTGRLLPKGSVIDIEIHYTTMGTAQTDQTEIGFYKLAQAPKATVQIDGAYNVDFSIAPGDSESSAVAAVPVRHDSMLFSMSPHMHLRGAWMRYEALYPSGKRETLLSVPHYDFNWQTSYELAKPKMIPAGTWILCSGGFDNSPLNPSNPAPDKRVTWGEQSFNEMFIGFVEGAEMPKPAPNSTGAQQAPASPNSSEHDSGIVSNQRTQ